MYRWFRRFYRWAGAISGKSYYHQPQNLGKAFEPNKCLGYFNDLVSKATWIGETDSDGIPLNILLENRKKVYFATTIVQKALGHYDRWLLFNKKYDFAEFIRLCKWLVKNQDTNGGWGVWENLGVKALTKYSAMTQGEGMSAMVRAWINTYNDEFRQCAKSAFALLVLPIEEGGTSFFIEDDLFLEEVPVQPRNTILNGWIFALMGLYDYYLIFDDSRAYDFFRRSLISLENHLADYDARYWSFYDVRGRLASHIYHNLHIAQLTALNMIEPAFENIRKYAKKWRSYQDNKFNYWHAIVVKGIQKIREAGEGMILR